MTGLVKFVQWFSQVNVRAFVYRLCNVYLSYMYRICNVYVLMYMRDGSCFFEGKKTERKERICGKETVVVFLHPHCVIYNSVKVGISFSYVGIYRCHIASCYRGYLYL